LRRHHKHAVLRWTAMTVNWLAVIFLSLSYLAFKITPSHHTLLATLALVYPLLLFINLFLVLFWLLVKDFRFLLSLVVILAGFHHLRTNFSFHRNTDNSPKRALKVISYNVQGFAEKNTARFKPEIKNGILTFLVSQKPSILCLQEYSGKNSDLFRRKSGGNTYFHTYYTQKGSKNTGLLIVARHPLNHPHYMKFAGYRTFGIFSDLVAGRDTLRIINVHLASISLKQDDLDLLSAPSSAPWEKGNVGNHFLNIYRKLQKAFRLREKQINFVVKTIQSSPFPVILCGDFNDTPSSNAYHRIAGMLQDAFVEKGHGMSTTYAGPLPFLRIDYLFAEKPFQILSYQKYSIQLSDHFPVGMEVSLPER
jgi:endonuclease/exonuclease/phosphatase family metal-dependent hydrolase